MHFINSSKFLYFRKGKINFNKENKMSKKKKILCHLLRNEDIEYAFMRGESDKGVLRNVITKKTENLYEEIYCFYNQKKIDNISTMDLELFHWNIKVDDIEVENVQMNKSKIFRFIVFDFFERTLNEEKIKIYFIPLKEDLNEDLKKYKKVEEFVKENEVYYVKISKISNNNEDKLSHIEIKLLKNKGENHFNIDYFGDYEDMSFINILENKLKLVFQPEEFTRIVTEDQIMIELKYDAKFYSKLEEPILIIGETGTGKELFAQAIHNCGKKSGEFVAVNCAAIPDRLFESEMFGHKKGAFTGAIENKIGKFESANNGTLFLDEIGELSLDNQTKLLRAIQEKMIIKIGDNKHIKINCRLICATNKDITNENIFRSDLLYRINTLELNIPPLRNRIREDKEILVKHFLDDLKTNNPNHDHVNFTDRSLRLICIYDWRGNVRELKNFISKAFYNAVQWYSPHIDDKYFDDYKYRKTKYKKIETDNQSKSEIDNEIEMKEISIESELKNNVNLKNILEKTEKEYIVKAIEITKNYKLASAKLGYNNSTFSKKLAKYKIHRK